MRWFPMTKDLCPRCGARLIESEWERVQETCDGGIMLDVHPVYKCTQQDCGYMMRYELVPDIIAQQGDDRLLLLYPNEAGRILDIRDNVIWPEIHYQSILGRGCWDPYTGNHDVSKLLENARDSEAAYLEAPNLFEFATSELSQDAFLCWFISWSQETHRSMNKPLHEAAVDFVSMVFNDHQYPVPTIRKINITRQFQSLDVLAIVNDTYAILIEDKTFTKNHSDQLNRYREAVTKACPKLIQLPVYYKIADQSHYQSVEAAGYIPFLRDRMLQVLNRGKEKGVTHPIYLDYLSYLTKLDHKVNAFKSELISNWEAFAW